MNDVKHMQCMEVWGGNRPIDSGVIMPGMDAWVYSQPCENQAAGGDVHYVSTCAGGMVVRLVVADISGHGDRVAETGANLRLMMRRHINRHDQLSVVRALNHEFTIASSCGVFATAVVMTFTANDNQLLVSNAGHPAPLWYQAKQRRWTLLQPQVATDGGGLPWGIEDESPYQQFQLRLHVGDMILCYTDSLAEAKGPSGEMLTPAGLLNLVERIGDVAPSQLIPRMLEEVARHDPQYASRDDVTCLAFRPNGLRPSIPMRDMLLAPFRWAMATTGMKFGYSGWKRNQWDATIGSGR